MVVSTAVARPALPEMTRLLHAPIPIAAGVTIACTQSPRSTPAPASFVVTASKIHGRTSAIRISGTAASTAASSPAVTSRLRDPSAVSTSRR